MATPEVVAPWVAFVLPVRGTGTLAVYALRREDVHQHARSAAQLALGIREGRALEGPYGSFRPMAAADDLQRAIMLECPSEMEWV